LLFDYYTRGTKVAMNSVCQFFIRASSRRHLRHDAAKIAQPNLVAHPALPPLPSGDESGVLNQVSAPEQFGQFSGEMAE